MHPSGTLGDIHMGDSMLSASSETGTINSPVDWSRKRKASDQALYRSLPDTSYQHYRSAGAADYGNSILGSPPDGLLGPGCNDRNRAWNPSNYVNSEQPNERNTQVAGPARAGQSPFSLGHFPSPNCREPASFLVLSTGQTLTVPNIQPSVCRDINPSEAYNAQTASQDQVYSDYEHFKPLQSNSVVPKVYDGESRNLYPSENLQQKIVQPAFSAASADHTKESSQAEIHPKENPDVHNIVHPCAAGVRSYLEHRNDNVLQSKSQLIAEDSNCYYQGENCLEASTKRINVHPDNQKQNLFSPRELPPRNAEIGFHKAENNYSDVRSDSEDTSAHAEKLWDGTLQLSSSTKVSMSAYFKSGDKMHDTSWPELVEVKGKTRLDAFEKYIQDLPRSRSRGLTVTSLSLNEGSSEAGRKAMKEVDRKYREGGRVGFARVSSGFDLYICPASDTVFAMLAKYVFLSSTMVDENLLLGCAVWRKNAVCDTVMKNLAKVGSQSLPSSSSTKCASVPQVSEKSSTSENLNHGTLQPKSDGGEVAVGDAGKSDQEGKNFGSSNVIEIGGTSSCVTPFSVHTGGEPLPADKLALVQEIVKQLSLIEGSILQNFGVEKQGGSLELLKSVLPPDKLELLNSILPPANTTKETSVARDDDDLPEYDFRAAVSQPPPSLPTEEMYNKKVPSDPRRRNGSPLLSADNVQGNSGPMGSEFFNRQQEDANQGQNLESQPRMVQSQFPSMPSAQEKDNAPCSRNMTAMPIDSSKTSSTKSKSLFSDDDDMPEWCPPDFGQPKAPPPAVTTGLPISTSTFKVPNPACISAPGPLAPLLPVTPSSQFQFGAKASPSSQLQATPFSSEAAPPQPYDVSRQSGPHSSTDWVDTPASRPQYNPFDQINNSVHPNRRNGWMP